MPVDHRALQLPHTSHGTSPSWTRLAKGTSSKLELHSLSLRYLCRLTAAFGPGSQLHPAFGKRSRATMNGSARGQPHASPVPSGCSDPSALAGQGWEHGSELEHGTGGPEPASAPT